MKKLVTTSLLSLSAVGFAQYPPSGGYDAAAAARDFNRQQQAMQAQREQIQRDNIRQMNAMQSQREQIQRDNIRQMNAIQAQREQIQRDNIREMNRANSGSGYSSYPGSYSSSSGYSSYPSGYSSGYAYPSGYSESYTIPSGYSPAPWHLNYLNETVIIDEGGYRVAKVVSSAPAGVQKWSASGVYAVDNYRTPKGATEYYLNKGTTYFVVPGGAAPEAVAAIPKRPEPLTRVVPTPVELKRPEDYLPKERYAQLSDRFDQNGVGAHAYLALVDEAIGPQAVDAPVAELPVVAESTLTALKKDRLTLAQALFDQGTLPDLKDLTKNEIWTGRCVFRNAPTAETGAMLGFLNERQDVRAVLITAASARQVADSEKNADPKKYDKLNSAHSAQIQGRLNSAKNELSGISTSPLANRPLTRDSLFFDTDSAEGSIAYRLRTFTTLAKKTVLVAEGYSTTKPGASFVGKRVDYLEPVQFCYFTQSWTF